MKRRRQLTSCAVCFSLLSSAAQAAPLYSIKDLTPDGYSASTAFDINSSGDAVGIATKFLPGVNENAYFFYDHSEGTSTVFGVGVVSPRGSIVGTGFREAAINDGGAIAGTATFSGGAPEARGFIYSGGDSGAFANLGTFYFGPGTGTNIRPASDAMDINSSGLATGTATSGAAIPEGVDTIDIYTGTSAPVTDIDGDYTVATRGDYGRAINDAGLIVGSDQDNFATIFSGASETVITGAGLGDNPSVALDLNESGLVVVENRITNASFIYDSSDSSLRTLPNLGTGSRVFGKAINEDGDAVGWGDRNQGLSGQGRGFVHDYSESTSYLLEDRFVRTGSTVEGLSDWERLRTAWGINDDGSIVGVGDRRFNGAAFPSSRAYLLIPQIPGDYDLDGDVDGADFVKWQRGESPERVGAGDLADWEANYGVVSAAAATAAVPEPATLLMISLAGAALFVRQLRHAATDSR